MEILKIIIDVWLDCMTIEFVIFDCKLTFLSIFIGTFLASLAIYAVVKLYL